MPAGSLIGAGASPADPVAARGPYARSKAVAELIALAADGRGLAVVAVRPHLVWGPGDTQLVARIVDRARRGRLPLIGSGAALVDTTYVINAVDALVAALDRCVEARGQALVVTNGEPRPVAELITAICRAAGAPPPSRRVPVSVALARRLGDSGGMGRHGPSAARAGCRRPADHPFPGRAAFHCSLVRPAPYARAFAVAPGGEHRRGSG